jgi:hypothetical protein
LARRWSGEIKRIDPADFESLLGRARAERWREIAVVGLDENPEFWPDSLKRAERVFTSTSNVTGLVSKLQPLPGVTSLCLWGSSVDAQDVEAIAASFPCSDT